MTNLLNGLVSRTTSLMAVALVAAVAGAFSLSAEAAPDGMGGPGMHGMRGGPGGEGGMGMMANPRHMERLLDSINANADQRTQIRQIMQSAQADMKAQRQAGRTLNEQNRALFAQPNVDANAVEANRQKIMAQHDAASRRMSQVMVDVSRVLSPDQRKQLSERMAQRRSMMERHQAERSALDKKP